MYKIDVCSTNIYYSKLSTLIKLVGGEGGLVWIIYIKFGMHSSVLAALALALASALALALFF